MAGHLTVPAAGTIQEGLQVVAQDMVEGVLVGLPPPIGGY